jgi:hypothetical protein
MLTILVCLKYSEVSKPYLKHTGNMTKILINQNRILENPLTQNLYVVQQF